MKCVKIPIIKMNRIANKILGNILGRYNFQYIFERLYKLSIVGMNYATSGDFVKSGELMVLNYIDRKLVDVNTLIIFDVGANTGDYSKAIANYFGGRAIIHSFEPSLKSYELLADSCSKYSNILPNNIGFSDSKTSAILYTNSYTSRLASLYPRELGHLSITMNNLLEIQLNTIDDYCENNCVDRIQLLKMDIEGHELNALKGAKRMLSESRIDYIQFEFGGCNIDSRTYFKDFFNLLESDYIIYRILKDGLREIVNYSEINEIFFTINFLAEHKSIQKH